MKTVAFDFDGVIHSYTSGWLGATEIPDPPVPGIRESIQEIRAAGYDVVVFSTRCAAPGGLQAVHGWLMRHDIVVDRVTARKPPAIAYIDDRAICFDGNSDQLLEKVKAFKPWYKKGCTAADLPEDSGWKGAMMRTFLGEEVKECRLMWRSLSVACRKRGWSL